MYQWWNNYHKHDPTLTMCMTKRIAQIRSILGQQDRTVVLRHRCWVWERPRQHWALYVDKRGPAFHVKRGCTPDQAREAFSKFRKIVEKKLSQGDK